MGEVALMLALVLGRPPGLVGTIYSVSGLDGVALVECESHFNPRALRREPRGHTSWGLWQLDDEYHPQHRGDLLLHVVEGAAFLESCKSRRETLAGAVELYNGSYRWGLQVQRKRDSLTLYLWRRLR